MKLAIVGSGTMGRIVRDMALQNPGIDHVSIIEPALGESLCDVPQPDVVIDFSHPDALPPLISYLSAKGGQVGAVFATTGYCREDAEQIRRLSEKVPVIKSSNFSYGVNTMMKILGFAAPLLSGCSDIEIVEKHHSLKTDAPSGTALMLADACDPEGSRERLCRKGRRIQAAGRDRHSQRQGRDYIRRTFRAVRAEGRSHRDTPHCLLQDHFCQRGHRSGSVAAGQKTGFLFD